MQSLRTEDPARVGEYAVLGRLGQGAMGRVYLARSPGGRFVAVKVVRPELADDPGFRERFRHEVASMRAVGGFWTAAVVDADPDGLWLATEYVPGPTLFAAVAAHGPLPLAALRGLVAGLAEALRAIHGAGLVHRDLKPANVLLAADGPRVIDFGIAKALESVGLTATGMFVGTPGFLSPEQIEGRDATPASDVFALGAVLAYAATGAGPFGTGDAAALLYRAVHAQPSLDGVPSSLRPLVARCLDRSPDARPSPSELLASVGPPEGPDWLPAAVRAMVTEQETEMARPSPRPPTTPYTKAGLPLPFGGAAKPVPAPAPAPAANAPAAPATSPPPGTGAPAADLSPSAAAPGTPPGSGNRAVFRVSRTSALVLAGLSTVGAFVSGGISQDATRVDNGGVALLFLVACLVLTVSAVRFWWIVVRQRRWVEVSGSGLAVGRGRRTTPIGWGQLARVRVVEEKRPWLVVWTQDGSHVDLGARYAGGYRVFPVGHERRKAGRRRETRELRAALGWYGRSVYDPSP
ncbi:MAG TPA: serine/threonine-protein kinase [Actinophytocola sp.]|nr:serine/threonine-protein kinase [Actinophytocola sp.]